MVRISLDGARVLTGCLIFLSFSKLSSECSVCFYAHGAIEGGDRSWLENGVCLFADKRGIYCDLFRSRLAFIGGGQSLTLSTS